MPQHTPSERRKNTHGMRSVKSKMKVAQKGQMSQKKRQRETMPGSKSDMKVSKPKPITINVMHQPKKMKKNMSGKIFKRGK